MKEGILYVLITALIVGLFSLAYNKKKDFKKIWPFIYGCCMFFFLFIATWNFAIDYYRLKLSEAYNPEKVGSTQIGRATEFFEFLDKAKKEAELLRDTDSAILGLSSGVVLVLLFFTYQFLNTDESLPDEGN